MQRALGTLGSPVNVMKAKTPGEVIGVLKDEIKTWKSRWADSSETRHVTDCLTRAIAIVRLWDAGITPADVRAASLKKKGKRG